MADATPALQHLASALQDLKTRMKTSDPRKRRINLLLLAIGGKFGADATAAQIGRIGGSARAVGGLLAQGVFADVMFEAESTVAAL